MKIKKTDNPCIKRLSLCLGKPNGGIANDKCQFLQYHGGYMMAVNGFVMYCTKTLSLPKDQPEGAYEPEPFFESGELKSAPGKDMNCLNILPIILPEKRIFMSVGKYVESLKPGKHGKSCIVSIMSMDGSPFLTVGHPDIAKATTLFQFNLSFLKPFADETIMIRYHDTFTQSAAIVAPADSGDTTISRLNWFMLLMPCRTSANDVSFDAPVHK